MSEKKVSQKDLVVLQETDREYTMHDGKRKKGGITKERKGNGSSQKRTQKKIRILSISVQAIIPYRVKYIL